MKSQVACVSELATNTGSKDDPAPANGTTVKTSTDVAVPLFSVTGDRQDVAFYYLQAGLSRETLKEVAKLDIDNDGAYPLRATENLNPSWWQARFRCLSW